MRCSLIAFRPLARSNPVALSISTRSYQRMAAQHSKTGHDERTSREPRSSTMHTVVLSQVDRINDRILTCRLDAIDKTQGIKVGFRYEKINCLSGSTDTAAVSPWPMAGCPCPRGYKAWRILYHILAFDGRSQQQCAFLVPSNTALCRQSGCRVVLVAQGSHYRRPLKSSCRR
jgi:hypothetical protein